MTTDATTTEGNALDTVLSDRRSAVEGALAKRGYRMDFDPGSVPGEGHWLVRIHDDQLVDGETADVPNDILALANEWSDLTDRLAEAQ